MKLINKLPLFFAFLSITMLKFIAAEDVDVTIEDDEAEIDDEMEIEDSEPAGQPEPEPLQIKPGNIDGVRSFVFFPDGPASITGGKMSEVVIGMQNNGDRDIEMLAAVGQLKMPDTNEVVQNLTAVGYENHAILSKSEASFTYMFMPHVQTGGREFQINIDVQYKEKDTSDAYVLQPFNERIQVLESTEGVTMEIVQLWMTVVALLVGGAYFLYVKQMEKKAIKEATVEGKKIERGTVNQDIDMAWIPKNHGKAQKQK